MHPTDILPTRRKYHFFVVMANSLYEMKFTKTIVSLLPWPYRTGCVHYDTHPDYSMYRTRDDCTNICIEDFCLEKSGCANYYTVITSLKFFKKNYYDYHICTHEKQVCQALDDSGANCWICLELQHLPRSTEQLQRCLPS